MSQDNGDKTLSRRRLLQSGAALAAAGFVRGTSGDTIIPRPAKIIVAGGHPGDPEYGCGGTVARLTGAGSEVVLLYLNEGEPREQTPRLPKGTRVTEARAACELLKSRPLFAGQIDGDAIVDRSHYEQFHLLIEAEKPDAVFTHWPIDNHADHRAMSMLVYDAWVRLQKSFALFYYEVSNGEDTLQFTPTHYVNIRSVGTVKRAACYAHASQSPDKFYELQESVAHWRGLESGHGQAEAFVKLVQSKEFPLP